MSIDAQTASAIAAAISAFAALVSLIVAVVAVYLQAQAGKPKVHVAVAAAMLVGTEQGPPYLDITAQNRGPLPVTIVSVGFDVGGGRKAAIRDPRDINGARALPRPLQPGEAVSIAFDFLELARLDADTPVRGAYVTTAAGGRYTGGIERSIIQSGARRAAGYRA